MKTKLLLFLLFSSSLFGQYVPEKIVVTAYNQPEPISRLLNEGWTVKKLQIVQNEDVTAPAQIVAVLSPPTHQIETMLAKQKAEAYAKAREEYLKRLPQPEKAK